MSENNEKSLSIEEISRYSRQLIIPNYGIESQIKLKNKSALIIGCGGLGCPAALYLCTAGVGTLGLLDNDTIEISNIHRQIAHDLPSVGKSKSKNLTERCKLLNDQINYKTFECLFEKHMAIEVIEQFDVILDCTDNVITRYLINDVCVLLNKPLVSGSALKFEGQLTVYNYKNGPCYRCLYSKAPSPETVSNCSDAGILGPVVGMIGSLQALEAIKVLTEIGSNLNGRMLIFDGFDLQTRIIKLRPRQIETCVMCKHTTITKESNNNSDYRKSVENILNSFDYSQFCGVQNYNDKTYSINILNSDTQRITCLEYNEICNKNEEKHLLIDVRPSCQYKICSLKNSINIPIDDFCDEKEKTFELINAKIGNHNEDKTSIYIVCRLGNDSQNAVEILKEHFEERIEKIKDLIGGVTAWANTVDENFPKY